MSIDFGAQATARVGAPDRSALSLPALTSPPRRPDSRLASGHVSSDLAVLAWWIGNQLGRDVEFLDNGRLNAYGLGGSLMLDYELKRPDHEIGVEWRYT